jgi:hypothetical protein
MRRRRSLRAVSTSLLFACALLLGLLSSARALKRGTKASSSSSSSSSGEDDATHRHLLDPALNTDEVRDAASNIGHIEDMDAYLAAIEHKMDVLQDHPAHNVRLISFLFLVFFSARSSRQETAAFSDSKNARYENSDGGSTSLRTARAPTRTSFSLSYPTFSLRLVLKIIDRSMTIRKRSS